MAPTDIIFLPQFTTLTEQIIYHLAVKKSLLIEIVVIINILEAVDYLFAVSPANI